MDDLIKRLQDRAETKLVAYDWAGHKLLFAVYEDDYVKEEPADKDCADALARIEQLEKELNISRMASVVMDNGMAELEAKLAKAVEALRFYVSQEKGVWNTADAVLAELEK
jgi:hypothetical protein